MRDGHCTVGVVVHVPDPIGAQVADIRAAMGDPLGSQIPTHITLLPPTRVTTEQHAALGQHLADVAARHRAFEVHLSGTDTFRPISDVVYVALAEGVEECRSLATTVCGGPVASPSPFAYHPHVTLAHDVGSEELDRVQAEHQGIHASFSADDLCLYEMSDEGPWRLQARFALNG
ncbi:MAG: 2'-5' RNA ligase family protein [Ornithinimicrobium sp.]